MFVDVHTYENINISLENGSNANLFSEEMAQNGIKLQCSKFLEKLLLMVVHYTWKLESVKLEA